MSDSYCANCGKSPPGMLKDIGFGQCLCVLCESRTRANLPVELVKSPAFPSMTEIYMMALVEIRRLNNELGEAHRDNSDLRSKLKHIRAVVLDRDADDTE